MRRIIGVVGVVAITIGSLVGFASGVNGPATATDPQSRGQYLVERVGICQDCHSPRDDAGAFLPDQWLGGAPIGFTPTTPMPWAGMAPPIAGLPTMSHEQAVHFMMSGEKPDGTEARPPHPEYRLNREDAEAVVTYLKSLTSQD
ncbi:MAG: cytochrome c [Acidobacteria bacterium]|jgi:mono/diheme cytochrome c family protein|nr:cytochrome c [Acidobacteriota bacterium]